MHRLGPEAGGITDNALSATATSYLLSGMPGMRTEKGWRKYPFFYTVLALTDLDDPRADDELRHVAAECGRKLKRLKPGTDPLTDRRIAIIERVLAKA